MKRLSIICLFLLAWAGTLFAQTLKSPDGNLTLQFRLSAEGTPVYSLQYKGKEVIKESKLGFSVRPDYQFDRNWDSAYALIINSTGISQSPTRRLRKATRLGNLYGDNTMKSVTTTTNCLWQ